LEFTAPNDERSSCARDGSGFGGTAGHAPTSATAFLDPRNWFHAGAVLFTGNCGKDEAFTGVMRNAIARTLAKTAALCTTELFSFCLNLTSHTYNEAVAVKIVSAILKTYFAEFEALRIRLNELSQEEQS
jgi:hypothetical protein